MRYAVIYGSVRGARQGIKAARFIMKQLQSRGHSVTLIDPVEHELPLLDKMYKEYNGGAPEMMEHLHGVLNSADCFVIVSAEYNHSVPPALKNLLDHFQSEYDRKPAGIATYSAGPFGGVRVAVHLRAVLGELGMITIPTMLPISHVQDAFDDEGVAVEKAYDRRVARFLDELEWYAKALADAR